MKIELFVVTEDYGSQTLACRSFPTEEQAMAYESEALTVSLPDKVVLTVDESGKITEIDDPWNLDESGNPKGSVKVEDL